MKSRNTILALIAIGFTAIATAGGDTAVSDIQANTLRDVTGIASVNVAAGDRIIQFNGIAVAVSQGGTASAEVRAAQQADKDITDEPASVAGAHIGDGAFADAHGIVTVNQASGQDNVQANGVAIALGIDGEALADSVLSQSLPDANPPNGEQGIPARHREVSMDDGVLEGTHGIVQVNQTAGAWNATANAFAIRVAVDVTP